MRLPSCVVAACLASSCLAASPPFADDSPPGGVPPVGRDGQPLNFDFEAGTLRDWTPDGPAFAIVEGDAVAKRRSDMKSNHQGRFWLNSFEGRGDGPQGSIRSAPFRVTRPWASFLLGGGAHLETRMEIVRENDNIVLLTARGEEVEDMKRFAADMSPFRDAEVYIRLVDRDSTGWGHVNFDDFRLHDARPDAADLPVPVVPDKLEYAGLSPEDAARAMTLPPGFKASLFAGEPDVVQPISMAIDDRGRVWIAEAYTYPHRAPEGQGRDRILILEDADGDGKFDKRTVFAEGLNLVSGIEVGFGGVFVGAAPEFYFIPDKDGDDRPDGPPEILLDGWGQHDTHETLNSFAWGPDGWLYGCHGVFTQSLVGKPGTPDDRRESINGGIWRYHPTKRKFEVFAHGTSNPWGIDWDERGQAVLTSCVIPHLYQMFLGGRYERQAGAHFNPYTYDDIKTIADHRHYVGDNPHRGNNRSDSMGGGHAHSGALIIQGPAWPESYRDSILMNNIHGARLNRDVFKKEGSGLVGSHAPDFLLTHDLWSQIISMKYAPDGSFYMIDWYDKNQCHRIEANAHDRTNGRVFQVSPPMAETSPPSLTQASPEDLVTHALAANPFTSRHARRMIQERGTLAPKDRDRVAALAFGGSGRGVRPITEPERLRALWVLHAAGGLTPEEEAKGLADDGAYVRAWTVQLATEDKDASSESLGRFAEMAKADLSPVVRVYLASALQRTPLAKRWDILAGLLSHGEDATDANLPLMDWYAFEPMATVDPARALKMAGASKIPTILPFMTRRIAALGTDQAIALLVEKLGETKGSDDRLAILNGLDQALKGRRQVAMPAEWPPVFASLRESGEEPVKEAALTLALTFGDPSALKAIRAILADPKAEMGRRIESLAALLKVRDPELAPTLRTLIASESPLRAPALRGLAQYADPAIPREVLAAYRSLKAAEKRDALNMLASRDVWAKDLLAAVEAKTIPQGDLSADLVRQIRNFKDASLDAQIAKVWGTVRETDADKAKVIARYRGIVRAGYAEAPDAMLGRAVFAKTCAQCHTLFGTGGKVGPELTGSNRADLEYLLSNVLDPNALIGKDYTAHVLATTDGRILTGIIRAEDKDAVTLVTANETITVPLDEIDERKPSDKSMMPEDIWTPLSDHEIRSLVAYLASPSQVPLLATAESAATFFNGKELSGWQGDPDLWKVEDGAIVGTTDGLSRNEFLRSELAASDFRVTFQVKLAKNEGNSGLQFRSEALSDGEMKGDQADIGVGWWGKLYEENGRGLLWDKSGEEFVRPGEWNTYEVEAIGSKIVTKINGHPCVDLDDPSGARRGIFAFQLHAGGPTDVRFKDLKLEVLAK